jgi:lactoylglutathione lyase
MAFAAVAISAASAQPAPQPAGQAVSLPGAMVGPALYVSDMNRSLKFYTEVLGMTARMHYGTPGKSDAIVGFGSDMTQPCIMLLFDRTSSPGKVEHAHGFDRIALMMADLPAVSAKLRAAGFKPGEIREVHGAAMMMMMVTDPDGYRLELIGNKPSR